MGFLTTEKFCGFLSLRCGGLILGWIPIMLSIYGFYRSVKSNQLELVGIFAVLALLLAFWLEGIIHKNSAWMFPMVIVWNVVLWAGIVYYAIAIYYHIMAPAKHPIFEATQQEMLIMPLAIVIFWHFACVSYSLYEEIDDKNHWMMEAAIFMIVGEMLEHALVYEHEHEYHHHNHHHNHQSTKSKRARRRRNRAVN